MFQTDRKSKMAPHLPASLPPASLSERILALDMPAGPDSSVPAIVVATASFAEVDAALLARLRPDLILLPLMSSAHDATAVIEQLQALNYAGRITVVALRLPNARMVETELRSLGPGNRLTLLTP